VNILAREFSDHIILNNRKYTALYITCIRFITFISALYFPNIERANRANIEREYSDHVFLNEQRI